MKEKEYKYKSFPKFNNHGSSCKGHENYMLDCTYEKEEDRQLLLKVLNHYFGDKDN